jgi:hypothetical protein
MTSEVILLMLVKMTSEVFSAWACPVCFRMEEGPVTDGVFAAVLVLLGVTISVLLGFAVFIHGFVRRLRAVGASAGQGRVSLTESERS